MKRNIQAILVLAGCTLASVAWAAEPGNDEGITKADVAKAFKPEFLAVCRSKLSNPRLFW